MQNPQPSLVFVAANIVMRARPTLDKVEELSLVHVLSNSIYKLTILREMMPYARSVWPEGYRAMSLRMKALEKLSLPEDRQSEYISNKHQVQKCRYFLQHLFEEIMDEMAYQGTWHYLEYIICCETLKRYDDFSLKGENENFVEAIMYLENKLDRVRETSKEILLFLSDVTERCLEKAVVSAWVQTKTAIRFAEVSAKARIDQSAYRLSEKERGAKKAIEKSAANEDEENVISDEIEKHLVNGTAGLQRKLESWMNRYGSEIEALDVALLQIKSKLEEQHEQHEKLLGQFITRQALLEEMQWEADERDRLLELKRAQNRAAAMIQNWWRNIIFWRGLNNMSRVKKQRLKSGKKSTVAKKSKKNSEKNKKT